jgi:hypothetical protein
MQAFDLNIEKVLEHWSVPFAIRELIANALDEQALTGTADPVIVKDGAGCWHIADSGRGVRYEHLTQNENAEKRRHPQVIGQFGMGLKDALAVFDRRAVDVVIRSPHAVITTGRRPKEGFPDIVTLHALVSPPEDPYRVGLTSRCAVSRMKMLTRRSDSSSATALNVYSSPPNTAMSSPGPTQPSRRASTSRVYSSPRNRTSCSLTTSPGCPRRCDAR